MTTSGIVNTVWCRKTFRKTVNKKHIHKQPIISDAVFITCN